MLHKLHPRTLPGRIVREAKRARFRSALNWDRVNWGGNGVPLDLDCVVFSRDRPLQLDALLRSMRELVTPQLKATVIFSCTEASYLDAYREIEEQNEPFDVRFVNEENDFRGTLLCELDRMTGSHIVFLVDDIVFVESIDIEELSRVDLWHTIPSLRLGQNVRYSYTKDIALDLPNFDRVSDRLLSFTWTDGRSYWGFPLSVDGHIFPIDMVRKMTSLIKFEAPNTFESGLQIFSRMFASTRGLCYKTSRLVNIPCNRVQDEFPDARSGETTPEELLELWNKGLRIDISKLRGGSYQSAHQEVPFDLIPGPNA